MRARRAPRLLLFVFAAACLWAPPAAAHPVPFSYVDLRLQPGAIEGTVVAHIFDLAHDLNVAPAERLLDPAVASQQSAAKDCRFSKEMKRRTAIERRCNQRQRER